MNAGFYRDITSYQGGRTYVDLVMAFAAAGAVPTSLGPTATGITSVIKSSTATYAVMFNEQAFGLLNYTLNVAQVSYAKTGACRGEVTAIDLPNRTITVTVVDAAGDATAPAENDVAHWTFVFQLSANQ